MNATRFAVPVKPSNKTMSFREKAKRTLLLGPCGQGALTVRAARGEEASIRFQDAD
jgi:hypothetical protein